MLGISRSIFRECRCTIAVNGMCCEAPRRLFSRWAYSGKICSSTGINQIVIAKLSSQAHPMDEKRILLTVRGIEAMRSHMTAKKVA